MYTNDLGFQAEYKFERILKLFTHTPTRKFHLGKYALHALKDLADHLERCKLQNHSKRHHIQISVSILGNSKNACCPDAGYHLSLFLSKSSSNYDCLH